MRDIIISVNDYKKYRINKFIDKLARETIQCETLADVRDAGETKKVNGTDLLNPLQTTAAVATIYNSGVGA